MRTFLFLLLMTVPAFATNCMTPSPVSGWAQTFYNTTIVSGFVYDQPNQILFTIMKSGLVNWEFNVPFGNVQSFGYSKTPDTFYTQQISPIYHWALLDDKCNAIIADNGYYIWSK